MNRYTIAWRPNARDDLVDLYDWIAERADGATAFEYTAKIEQFVTGLSEFPERGTPRDDLVIGMRTLAYRRRTVIAYRVRANQVEVLRIIRTGQDWTSKGFLSA